MKTITKWTISGVFELIVCFWLLGTAANLVSAPSNLKVAFGVVGYLLGFGVPIASAGYVATRILDARTRQKQLKEAFPDDNTTILKLLDTRR